MKTKQTLNLKLLRDTVKTISPTQCNYFAEAAVIAMENQGHSTGVELRVEGDFKASYILEWEAISQKKWMERTSRICRKW